mgnify:CR=1 FL=1
MVTVPAQTKSACHSPRKSPTPTPKHATCGAQLITQHTHMRHERCLLQLSIRIRHETCLWGRDPNAGAVIGTRHHALDHEVQQDRHTNGAVEGASSGEKDGGILHVHLWEQHGTQSRCDRNIATKQPAWPTYLAQQKHQGNERELGPSGGHCDNSNNNKCVELQRANPPLCTSVTASQLREAAHRRRVTENTPARALLKAPNPKNDIFDQVCYLLNLSDIVSATGPAHGGHCVLPWFLTMASMNDGAGVGAGGASSGAGMGAGAGADVGDTAMTTDRFQLSNVYKGDDVSVSIPQHLPPLRS